jgi:hypothetical protein
MIALLLAARKKPRLVRGFFFGLKTGREYRTCGLQAKEKTSATQARCYARVSHHFLTTYGRFPIAVYPIFAG